MIFWLGRASVTPHVHCLPFRLRRTVSLPRLHATPALNSSRSSRCCSTCPSHPASRPWSSLTWRPLNGSRRLCATAAKTAEVSEVQKQLSSQAPRGTRWRKVKQWVVFSDLHLSHKTLDTVLKVLERVHEEASQRDAGILFLGDFWHLRGSLPVEPLNAVLCAMDSWKVPVLMLVGNHDQVTAGGLSHGLTPLQAANPNIHVFDAPTFYLGALWLPYRRDPTSLLEAIAGTPAAKAIFAHVDVVGAFMNNTFQATDGLSSSTFPDNIPTYTGHYHKPHVVGESNIRYVGSPYQVSRSEAGQCKELLILDSKWQEVAVVPLDIGPRFFDLPASGEHMDKAFADVRQGDRVRMTVQAGSTPEEAVMQKLRDVGAEVEVIELPAEHAPRIAASEAMGSIPLFRAYAATAELPAEAVAAGQQILEDLVSKQEGQGGSKSAMIQFQTLELQGYGPFRDKVSYNLENQGIRVISGSNLDDDGSMSNGAGKSALVMSALWALTGRTDPRAEGGGRVLTASDLVNDDSKLASVKVTGLINGNEFIVERATRRKKLAKLTLKIAGEDLTKAEARLTQAAIEEHLAVDLLARVAFHGQSDITALLEAGDSELKQELGRLVDIEVWEAAKLAAAERLKAARQASLQLERDLAVRQSMLLRIKQESQMAVERAAGWASRHAAELDRIRNQLANAEQEYCSRSNDLGTECASLRSWLSETAAAASADVKISVGRRTEGPDGLQQASVAADVAAASGPKSHGAPITSLEDADVDDDLQAKIQKTKGNLNRATALLDLERTRSETLKKEVDIAKGAIMVREAQLQEYQQLCNHQNQRQPHGNETTVMVCDRCLQPISSSSYQENLLRLQAELEESTRKLTDLSLQSKKQMLVASQPAKDNDFQRGLLLSLEQELERRQYMARQQAEAGQQAQKQQELEAAQKQEALQQMQRRAELAVQEASELLAGAEQFPGSPQLKPRGMLSLEDASGTLEAVLLSTRKVRPVFAHMQRCQHALEAHQSQTNEHEGEAHRLKSMQQEEEALEATTTAAQQAAAIESAWLAELDAAFSRTGIQSFAIEGVLGELQVVAARYLEQLSTGMALKLSATRPSSGQSSAVERISKAVQVQTASGEKRERTVRQLSGGERRRVGLALALGFSELIAARSRLRTNLVVLDEVLQHLDEEGNARVCSVLRGMHQDTVLIVGQADSYVAHAFDAVDIVVKQDGRSHLQVAA
ncbi:hypothetical protein WJX74_010231 [Apatococcus lobatus]|uniref:Uncharacterized protein n=1 Tax=Apatococcus lobatus TaxID=904363 RepID=A0AAW1RCH5_9CHLO